MKNTLPAITAAVTLLLVANLGAGEISVYKDKDGVITLTDRPLPSGTRVQHVIHYKDRHPETLKPPQEGALKNRSRIDPDSETRRIRELREKADRTSKKAEKERARARERIKAAEAYLERYRQKNRRQRRRNLKEARRMAREAEEAQARANMAIDQANQAREAARKAIAAQSGKDQ